MEIKNNHKQISTPWWAMLEHQIGSSPKSKEMFWVLILKKRKINKNQRKIHLVQRLNH